MTTRLERTGASAGAANLRCDCRMPYSTTARPYSRICGANTTSIRAPRATIVARGHPGVPPSSSDTSGRAVTATRTLTGTRSSTAQLISADEVCRTCSRSAGAAADPAAVSDAGPASTGTTTAVRAPPMMMS